MIVTIALLMWIMTSKMFSLIVVDYALLEIKPHALYTICAILPSTCYMFRFSLEMGLFSSLRTLSNGSYDTSLSP